MKLLIAVPSRSRSSLITETVLKNILPCVSQLHNCELRVFVEPQQCRDYAEVVPYGSISVLPENNMGNEFACDVIGSYAARREFDLVLKVDDDVYGFVQRFSATRYPEKAQQVFMWMVKECVAMFEKEPKLGGIGYPYAHQMWNLAKWMSVNSRLQTCYMVRAEHMRTPYRELHHWEDFYRYLRILNVNQFTLRYGLAGISCAPVGTTLGGCQDYDRAKQAKQSMDYLNRMWPGIQWKPTEHSWKFEPNFRTTRTLASKQLFERLDKEKLFDA